jgi:hypothetical protein
MPTLPEDRAMVRVFGLGINALMVVLLFALMAKIDNLRRAIDALSEHTGMRRQPGEPARIEHK